VNSVGIALNALLTVFAEERVWIVQQKSQADCPPLMLEPKLHVKLDRVTAKSDVVRWIGFVPKGQLESKLLGVERDRSLDVPRAENRVRFFEHCRLWGLPGFCSINRSGSFPIKPRAHFLSGLEERNEFLCDLHFSAGPGIAPLARSANLG
jgi:hypothetical protein